MSQYGDSASSDDESHVPEHIVDFKWTRKGRFYRIKWATPDEELYKWEDAEDIEPLYPTLVSKFWEQVDTRWPPRTQAEDLGYLAQGSEDYNSSQDEDFQANNASDEEDDDQSSEDKSVDWRTVRSIEGMDKTLDGKIRVYVRWSSGRKSIHSLPVVKRRCAEKLLAFYENHLQVQGMSLRD